jgi:hypothetical protein
MDLAVPALFGMGGPSERAPPRRRGLAGLPRARSRRLRDRGRTTRRAPLASRSLRRPSSRRGRTGDGLSPDEAPVRRRSARRAARPSDTDGVGGRRHRWLKPPGPAGQQLLVLGALALPLEAGDQGGVGEEDGTGEHHQQRDRLERAPQTRGPQGVPVQGDADQNAEQGIDQDQVDCDAARGRRGRRSASRTPPNPKTISP